MNHNDRVIRHIDQDYCEPVRDPVWHHIYLTKALLKLVDSSPFRTLHRIRQLGPTYLVYPGATHSRFNHSLGVFHIAKRMLRALLSHADCPSLSLEAAKAFLCAGLLHDLGHFPYAHSLKELPLSDHEQLTADLIEQPEIAGILADSVGVDPLMVAAIVDEQRPTGGNSEITLFRHLLSGPLDPDKLDYLNRDAFFCGVPYGVQDIDFTLSRIRPYGYAGIAIEESGVSAVEHILFAKYLMYRAVYWHRTVRIATAMIKKALFLGLRQAVVQKDALYGLTDDRFVALLADSDFEPFRMASMVEARRLFVPIDEQPFDEFRQLHRGLEDLSLRDRAESAIAEYLADHLHTPVTNTDVVIDIPEAVSFEVGLGVHRHGAVVPYIDSGTVFSPQVVAGFTGSLRKVRTAIHPRLWAAYQARTPKGEPNRLQTIIAGVGSD